MTPSNVCPHCAQPLFVAGHNGAAKIGRTALVLHKSGDVEANCGRCRAAVIIGRLESLALRKAAPRLVIRPRDA